MRFRGDGNVKPSTQVGARCITTVAVKATNAFALVLAFVGCQQAPIETLVSSCGCIGLRDTIYNTMRSQRRRPYDEGSRVCFKGKFPPVLYERVANITPRSVSRGGGFTQRTDCVRRAVLPRRSIPPTDGGPSFTLPTLRFLLFIAHCCCCHARSGAQGKGIVIETEESKKIKRKEEDLNGVNPFYAILGAGGAAAMSFGSWKVSKVERLMAAPAWMRWTLTEYFGAYVLTAVHGYSSCFWRWRVDRYLHTVLEQALRTVHVEIVRGPGLVGTEPVKAKSICDRLHVTA